MSTSDTRLNQVSHATLDLLQRLGILFHPGKCELTPTPSLSFLGMQLDIPNQLFKLTPKQHEKIKERAQHILRDCQRQQRHINKRTLAKAIGYF